ncbi:protein PELPK1 [Cajanus cajan]|nr:protein PELPK1 [Cajanus cajan]
MASHHSCMILAFLIAISSSSINMALAARQLLQTTLPPLPTVPTLPQGNVPPLPTIPLPSMPNIPSVPKVTLPPLPTTSLPNFPSIPTIPTTFPSIPFFSPPPSTTTP